MLLSMLILTAALKQNAMEVAASSLECLFKIVLRIKKCVAFMMNGFFYH